jgi:lipoprotein-anchoring transpeptidase ErfK/SrfK
MRTQTRGAAALGALAGLLLAAGLTACTGPHRAPTRPGQPAGAPGKGPGQAGRVATPYRPSASTLLATAEGTIPEFAAAGGPQTGQVPGTWHDAPSTLPVVARRPGWLQVRLAQRPNQSTAWVRAKDVTLSTTPYAIKLDLATTRLTLYKSGQQVFSAPVGVGNREFPTPEGTYFVAFLAEPPVPAYGSFVMVTSAHSPMITDWQGSGDGMVGIHGPLHTDAQIGTTGARVSHGCIRLHEKDLLRLREVPAGSPVTIVSS